MKLYTSHGTGEFSIDQFAEIGTHVIIESGVLVFHPENIHLGDNIYIGHNTILKGYYKNRMVIGSNSWIGQGCFFHSAGGISIANDVGIGPGVKIITSSHAFKGCEKPILQKDLEFDEVCIEEGCDIGVGAIILQGACIGQGSQIGAGAVVTQSIPPFSLAVGVPAKVIDSHNVASD